MEIRILTTVITLLVFHFCFSQKENIKDVNAILEKVQAKYDGNKEYDYLLSYKMYRGNNQKPEKVYKGRVAKYNNSFFYEAAGTETVISENQYVRASHEQKMIEYDTKNEGNSFSPVSIKSYIGQFEKGQLEFDNKAMHWKIILSVGKLTTLPYNKIELYINKDYTIARQVIYYLKKIPFIDNKGNEVYDFPRLEMVFDKNITSEKEILFDIKNYVTINKKNVTPSSKLKGYKIIDLSKK